MNTYITTHYNFYQTYVNLLDQDYRSREAADLTEFEKRLRFSKFRTFFLESQGYTFESILRIERIMLTGMLRPQRLLIDQSNFYVACDMITNTYYICYKHLMMIDIDFYKESKDKEPGGNSEGRIHQILDMFKLDAKESRRCWGIYRTKGGIHAFLLSKKMDHHNKESVDLMIKLGSDFNYIIYSYLRGWCVRLNRKKKEDQVRYTDLGVIGDGALEEHIKLVNLHLNLVNVFKDETPCNMFGV